MEVIFLSVAVVLPPLSYFLKNGLPLVAFNFFYFPWSMRSLPEKALDRLQFVTGIYATVTFYYKNRSLGNDFGELWIDNGLLKFIGESCEFALSAQNVLHITRSVNKGSTITTLRLLIETSSDSAYEIEVTPTHGSKISD